MKLDQLVTKQKEAFLFISYSFYLICLASIFFILFHLNVLKWPISPFTNLSDSLYSVSIYIFLSLLLLPSLLWLRLSNRKILVYFKWNQPHFSFFFALVVSVGLSVWLYANNESPLLASIFWLQAFIIIIMNSCCEETVYRLVLQNLIRDYTSSANLSIFLQSFFYAIPHLYISGYKFVFFTYCYGLFLGYVSHKSQSITPTILCHIIIDFGFIGLPLLTLSS